MKRILVAFIICILMATSTACNMQNGTSDNASATYQPTASSTSIVNNVSATYQPTASSTSSANNETPNAVALSAYKAVLLNEAKFTTDDKNAQGYLKDYPYLDHVIYFALVDMDGDGVSEIIIKEVYDEIDVDSCRAVVLHYANDKVFGYFFSAGDIYNVKNDGTFSYSGGDGYGCVKIHSFKTLPDPINAPIKPDDFLCFNSKDYSEFSINNKPVSKEKLDAFTETQKQKGNVVWNIVNKANVESQLVNK